MDPNPKIGIDKPQSLTPTTSQEGVINMDSFRTEIRGLIRFASEEHAVDREFINVLPSHLTEMDAKMWKRAKEINDKPITKAELEAYNKDLEGADQYRITFGEIIKRKIHDIPEL